MIPSVRFGTYGLIMIGICQCKTWFEVKAVVMTYFYAVSLSPGYDVFSALVHFPSKVYIVTDI
jgi:hypothetical protein